MRTEFEAVVGPVEPVVSVLPEVDDLLGVGGTELLSGV